MHHATENVITHRKSLMIALSSATIFRARRIRVSMSQLLSVQVGEKYLVAPSARGMLTPIGGVVRFFPSELSHLVGRVHFKPEISKGPEQYDLRGFVNGR